MIQKIMNEIFDDTLIAEIRSMVKTAIVNKILESINNSELMAMQTVKAFGLGQSEPVAANLPAEPAEPARTSAPDTDEHRLKLRQGNLTRAVERLNNYMSDIMQMVNDGIRPGKVASTFNCPIAYAGAIIAALGYKYNCEIHNYEQVPVEKWQIDILASHSAPSAVPAAAAEELAPISEPEPVCQEPETSAAEPSEPEPEPVPQASAADTSSVLTTTEQEALYRYREDMEYLDKQAKMIEHHVKKGCSPKKILSKLHKLFNDAYLDAWIAQHLHKTYNAARVMWVDVK